MKPITARDAREICPLFAGIAAQDFTALLGCLGPLERRFAKGETIFRASDRPAHVGIVLEGGAQVLHEDFWGHRDILAHISKGQLFAAAWACAQTGPLPFTVAAAEDTTALLVDYRRIFSQCSNACAFHARLTMNMARILADETVQLTAKVQLLARRSTRAKLLAYLSAQARLADGDTVTLPFNRQELADYLAVDRSALSRELGNMRKEGLLDFERNRFTLRH